MEELLYTILYKIDARGMIMLDMYNIQDLFNYYRYISYEGMNLYLHLCRYKPDNEGYIRIRMTDLSSILNMTPKSIRKYEIICVALGLMDVEYGYIKGGSRKDKRYLLYKPLGGNDLHHALSKGIYPNVERTRHMIREKDQSSRLEEIDNAFKKISSYIPKRCSDQSVEIKRTPFKKDLSMRDSFFVDLLFSSYPMLSHRSRVFYLYMRNVWMREKANFRMIRFRKLIKSELKFGDQEIREDMCILETVGLIGVMKNKYYTFTMNHPLIQRELTERVQNKELPKELWQLGLELPRDDRDFNYFKKLHQYYYDNMKQMI